jgi:hypothetical protein
LDKLSEDKTTLIAKNDEFTSWANSVVSHVRKRTPKWHEYKTYRITNRVAEAVENGLELVF